MLNPLVEAVTRYTDAQTGVSPFVTAVDGLTILRSNHERRSSHTIFKPALCIVAQGAKWSEFGGSRVAYRAGQALIVSIEMPASGSVVEASPEEPYLGIIVEFDLAIMREVFEGLETPPQDGTDVMRGIFVTDFDGPLTDCALRLVRLLDTPKAIPLLYPVIMREICYWLLTGPHGAEVAKMTILGGHARRVINAIHTLRDRFAEPIRIEDLARIAQLSPSAFHRQFKALTSMTPLQYQKQLRLVEARRLMVSNSMNVETAAFKVGYESPSQFSREYSRMFGTPPRRDIASLRAA
ncbi:AraC family transcriptional regulator [Rhizobium sp. BK251]|uniref:AraC family transcriptional regulator n=1 Tax=Rhizobium sp. BK251 TaxID=2512125 RepID=UPI001048A3F3|nr:AraC family transcriptional regulator [Rhizobium sp. BK251]TCL68090.1 AraC family transcriptional regulator [Rhizobium sp. BK251]